jgi:cytoskeletal protein CcmA (bactofilin family)
MLGSKKIKAQTNAVKTVIGDGTMVEGKLISQTGMRIEGEISGDIECAGDIVVGEKGIVKSNIIARDVIIAGQVYGHVQTKGKLTILKTGQLIGNMYAHTLIIEEGGLFQGSSRMDKHTESPSVQELPPSPPKTSQKQAAV